MDLFQLLPYLLSFLFFLPIILYWKVTNGGSKLASKLPPGSSSTFLPFVGHTISFINPHPSSSMGNFLQRNINRYGKIFQSHLFGRPTIVSCDAEFNSYVLNNEERLFITSYPKTIPGVLGEDTLLTVSGETHKHLRGLVVSLMAAIKNPEKSSFFSDIEDSALSVLSSWLNRETVVLCDQTRKFTFSVIVKQILSLKPEEEDAMELLKCYKTFMRGLTSPPFNFPGTPYAKAIKARHRINDILRGRIKKRLQVPVNERLGLDFLDILLAEENISEKKVLSLMLDLLLGGYETTAMLIAIMVKYLSENPTILEELKEEHIGITKSKRGEKLGWDDYKKMEFTQCLINESLRVGNVVKFLHRETIKPIEFKGFEIPAGWKILPVITGVHLDPSLHSEPSFFNPYRWKNLDSAREKNFMPFGGGKRMCPGYELSKLEASLFIHHLLLKYTWAPLNSSDCPISYPYLDFKEGLQIAIKPLQLFKSHN